jgi:hypothetical protein
MIKPSIFNAINFSPDFNRESKFFDASLQRKRNIYSSTPNPDYRFLSFFFKPDAMPEGAAPTAILRFYWGDSGSFSETGTSRVITLTDGYIYFFNMFQASEEVGKMYCRLTIAGYTEACYSEECISYLHDELTENNIVEVVAYNNDETHGYISQTYPACGFFRVSEFNNKVFGVEKDEYSYSYGRKKILNSENYIKTRITFLDLSMYQQNLLKTLCNCENLKINGISYYLVSDFTEVDKNEENEICSLRAEFIEIADTTFFGTGATEMPTDLDIKNLFTI